MRNEESARELRFSYENILEIEDVRKTLVLACKYPKYVHRFTQNTSTSQKKTRTLVGGLGGTQKKKTRISGLSLAGGRIFGIYK